MKERPILFQGAMVRAILNGTKTQTRRMVQPRHQWYLDLSAAEQVRRWGERPFPYGRPGDRLWVREAWRIGSWDDGCNVWLDYCDGPDKTRRVCSDVDMFYRLLQQTGDDLKRKGIEPTNGTLYEWEPGQSPLRWRPSIHMPRWASRILLEITGVRVERLQDISEADAIAEGIENDQRLDPAGTCHWRVYGSGVSTGTNLPERSYESLWESINGDGSWDANPWVWVVEFRRATP